MLSCIYKLYTKILTNRLDNFCDLNNIRVDEQNGFRKDRSCVDHIFTLTCILRNRQNLKMSTFAAFIDFQKAFDCVDRDLLMYKLIRFYNINGMFYKAVKSLHENSLSSVRINDLYTDWFSVKSGVRQGDSFSPLLFSLYVNDLAVEISSLNCGVDFGDDSISILMYADDMVFLSPTEHKLQKLLNTLYEWCKKWRMMLNKEKTQIVHFRPCRKEKTNYGFTFGGHLLQIVDKYKYLGLYLNEKINYSVSANILAEAGGRALGSIRNKLNSIKECGYNTFTKMYNAGVLPVMVYAAGVWGFKNYDKLDNLQRKAMRYFLGVHRFASNHVIEGDMGWPPTSVSRHVEMLRLWNRLVTLRENRLTKKIFDYDYNCLNNNWSSEVKQIFTKIDKIDLFLSKSLCDVEEAKDILFKVEIDKWEQTRYSKCKLRYYNIFKTEFGVEDYVKLNLPKYKRSIIAQFRSGILPLSVETGRFRNIPLEDRICIFCNHNQIEDEFHFLTQCPLYELFRKLLYDQILLYDNSFVQLDDFDKFIYININFQNLLVNFLCRAVTKRNECIYS